MLKCRYTYFDRYCVPVQVYVYTHYCAILVNMILVFLWIHSFCAALKYFFLCYSSFLMLCFILLILTLESPILNLPPLYCIIDYYLRIMCVTNLEFAWHAHNFLNLTYSTVYTICILYLQRSVLNNDNTWVTQTIGFFHRRHFNMNL